MLNIENIELLDKYHYLEQFKLYKYFDDDGVHRINLTMYFSDCLDQYNMNYIKVDFTGISGLKIVSSCIWYDSCYLFNIEDIKSRQLEKLNYYVEECEEDAFSFMCHKIKIEAVEDFIM